MKQGRQKTAARKRCGAAPAVVEAAPDEVAEAAAMDVESRVDRLLGQKVGLLAKGRDLDVEVEVGVVVALGTAGPDLDEVAMVVSAGLAAVAGLGLADRKDSWAEVELAGSEAPPSAHHPSCCQEQVVEVQVPEADSVRGHPIVDPAGRQGHQAAGTLAGVHPEATVHQLGSVGRWLAALSRGLDVP
jgi:hypothetical protein